MLRNLSSLDKVLILAVAALIIATACFFLGGIIAEVTKSTPIQGLTFKAGGALAGFLISFAALFFALQKLEPDPRRPSYLMLTVAVTLGSKKLPRTGQYRATITVLKPLTGIKEVQQTNAIWTAGNLTVHLLNIERDDLVMIVLTDEKSSQWESEYFSPLSPTVILS